MLWIASTSSMQLTKKQCKKNWYCKLLYVAFLEYVVAAMSECFTVPSTCVAKLIICGSVWYYPRPQTSLLGRKEIWDNTILFTKDTTPEVSFANQLRCKSLCVVAHNTNPKHLTLSSLYAADAARMHISKMSQFHTQCCLTTYRACCYFGIVS